MAKKKRDVQRTVEKDGTKKKVVTRKSGIQVETRKGKNFKTRVVFDTNKDQIKKDKLKGGAASTKTVYNKGGKDITTTKYRPKSGIKKIKTTAVSQYSPEYTGDEYKDRIKKKAILKRVQNSEYDGKETKTISRRRNVVKGQDPYQSVFTGSTKSKTTTEDGVKTKQKFRKDGTVKKTVTRTKGGVEKEIERGKKRIDVRKYKDEGVKTRKVTDMKKNDQYKADQVMKDKYLKDLKRENNKDFKNMIDNAATSDYMRANQDAKDSIKNSSFARLPINMVNEALKPENNILPANVLDKIQQKKNQRTINMLNRESEKQRKENQ